MTDTTVHGHKTKWLYLPILLRPLGKSSGLCGLNMCRSLENSPSLCPVQGIRALHHSFHSFQCRPSLLRAGRTLPGDISLVCAVCSIHQGLCSPGTGWEARGGSSASILPSSRLGAPPSGFCLFQRKNPWDNSQMVPSDSPGAFHRHMVAYLGPESRVGRN